MIAGQGLGERAAATEHQYARNARSLALPNDETKVSRSNAGPFNVEERDIFLPASVAPGNQSNGIGAVRKVFREAQEVGAVGVKNFPFQLFT
jgi:hypothetical protein